MRRLYTIIIVCALLFTSGCERGVFSNYREIAQLQVIETLGVDVTAGGVTVSASTGSSPEGKRPVRLTAGGESVTAAMERLQAWSTSEEIYYPHTAYVLLGESAAGDVSRFLDYIARSIQLRLDTPLLIVRGGEAGSVVSGAGGEEGDVSQILASIERELKKTGELRLSTCGETALELSWSGAALVCALREQDNLGSGEGKTVLAEGYAIIKNGALCGYLSGDAARGASLLLGQNGAGSLTTPTGATAELSLGGVDVSPRYDERGALAAVSLKLKLNADLTELAAPLDVTDGEIIGSIEREYEAIVAEWTRYVLKVSQQTEADFLCLRRRLELKAPSLRSISDEAWESAFPALLMESEVEVTLRRSYELGKSADNEGGRG